MCDISPSMQSQLCHCSFRCFITKLRMECILIYFFRKKFTLILLLICLIFGGLMWKLKFEDKWTNINNCKSWILKGEATADFSLSMHGWVHRYCSWHRSYDRETKKNRISINNILEGKFLVENILVQDIFIKLINNSYKGYAAILS